MKTPAFQALLFTLALTSAIPVQASTLLVGTGVGATTTLRDITCTNTTCVNFGHGILASVNVGNSSVAIDQFAIHGQQLANGNMRFSIFDASTGVVQGNGSFTPNLTRVYDSGAIATPAMASLDWILSPTFSLTLDANKTYYMGIISDQSYNFSSDIPAPAVDFGLGLSMTNATGAFADRGRNGNFKDFADPTFTRTGWAQISARVYGTTPVPLPAAVWLFGSGLIGLFGIRRPRANSQALGFFKSLGHFWGVPSAFPLRS